jgi:hypothetical protein
MALAMGGEVEVLAPSGAAAEGEAVRVGLVPGGLPPRIFRVGPEKPTENLQFEDNLGGPPRVSNMT